MREITRFNKICETYDLPKIYCSLSITDTLASTGANQDLGFGLLLRHCGDHSLLVGRPLDRHHVILMLFFASVCRSFVVSTPFMPSSRYTPLDAVAKTLESMSLAFKVKFGRVPKASSAVITME